MLDMKQELGQWYSVLKHLLAYPTMITIGEILGRDEQVLQPKLENVFRAFKLTAPHDVKVLIIGQDPYPGGEADGLAFSSKYKPRPYSLKVIFEELERDGFGERYLNDLTDWAEQGVMLLNTNLTTVKGHINGHHDIGWYWFTMGIVRWLILSHPELLILSWGTQAKDFLKGIAVSHPANILQCPHPAAQKHGYKFIGCGHFSKTNEWLINHGKTPIVWNKKRE